MTSWDGLFAATVSILNPDASVSEDPNLYVQYAEHLLSQGVKGVFIGGTTGESVSFNLQERKKSTELWVSAKKKTGIVIIAHIGCESIQDARELATHAQEVGADAIACQTPVFFSPDVSGLVAFCEQVALAAPQLPFFYYHFPQKTGSKVELWQFLKEAKPRIPSLAGAKFTSIDFYDLISSVQVDSNLKILPGFDMALLSTLPLKCRGFVGVSYNVLGPLYNDIIAAFEKGDMEKAFELQTQSANFFRVVEKYGFIQVHKALLKRKGIEVGPCRLPLTPLEREEEFFKELEEIQSEYIQRTIKK